MPPLTSTSLFVCPRCQIATARRSLTAKRTKSTSAKYAHLTQRCLIRLKGPDAGIFLHNIVPAKTLDAGTNPIYTAFLSAQGRILNDVFIYPPNEDEWYVEVDSESAGALLSHFRKHKLRSKFKLDRVDTGVYYGWPGVQAGGTGRQDPRPGMGTRWIGEPETVQRLKSEADEATAKDYTVHRMLNGVAEGQTEIIASSALPQESNIDFFGGIDFHKGCYLGQELTIRTHHTGVVRKRIVPAQLYSDEAPAELAYNSQVELSQPSPGSNISKVSSKKSRSTGKWLDGVGNIGLALSRLEMMTDIQLTADRSSYDPSDEYHVQWEDAGTSKEVKLKPFVPQWLRDGITANLNRKEKKPTKMDDEDEDEYNYNVN